MKKIIYIALILLVTTFAAAPVFAQKDYAGETAFILSGWKSTNVPSSRSNSNRRKTHIDWAKR